MLVLKIYMRFISICNPFKIAKMSSQILIPTKNQLTTKSHVQIPIDRENAAEPVE